MKNSEITKGVKLTPFEFHPGIYFENHGTAYLSTTKWNIYAYYDLKHYATELRSIRSSIKELKLACNSINQHDCMEGIKTLEDHYQEIKEKNEIIFIGDRGRQKRATLNFIGNILGDVFGVLDSRFAEEYTRDLGKIKNNEEHLLMLMKNHTSITETTLNIARKNEDNIILQANRVNKLINDMVNMTNEQQQTNQLLSATLRIANALTKYEHTQTNILNILLDVHNGQINANILTPVRLRTELQKIHGIIDATILVPGEDAHEELRSLYGIMSIQATTMHEQLIFRITLPLMLNRQFQVFKLISIPTRQNDKYIWFVPSTQFLLTTLQRNYYYPMREAELDKCASYGTNAFICERRQPLVGPQTTHINCEILMLNHDTKLAGNCTFKTTSIEDVWIPLTEPNKWIYAIYNDKKMNVICNGHMEHVKIDGEGILQLQPHCNIKQSTFEIAAQINYDTAIPGSILPEINLTIEIERHKQQYNTTLLSYSKSNISTLTEMIQATRHNEQQLPETLDVHNIHHYGWGYILLLCVISYGVYHYIQHRRRQPRSITIEELPMQRLRTISMPDLGREDV